MKKYDILEGCILQVSGHINKKALRETIENEPFNYDLNDLLYRYYLRVHRMKKPYFYNMTTKDDMTADDWKQFQNDCNIKKYRKQRRKSRTIFR